MKPFIVLPTVAGLALLTACGPIRVPGEDRDVETALETDTPPAEAIETPAETPIKQLAPDAVSRQAVIDWEAARRDFAERPLSGDADMFSVAAASAAPVPVLLPSDPVAVASSEGGVAFRPMADGYFAVYPGQAYDTIITGTDRIVAAPDGPAISAVEDMRFETTMTGAQVVFNRYGAAYSVEFACKDAAAALGDGCISEAEAIAKVEDLLIAGTQ